MTTEEFIKIAKEVHGDKYDYSKVEYKNDKSKVCIICPVHGEFWQRPSHHLSGHECTKCGREKIWAKRGRMSTDEWVEKAKKVHGDKYDYSKVEYIDADAKVCIICPEHGEFWQKPSNHLSGRGCNMCRKSHQMTTEEFVAKAREIYGGKYDYSKSEYVKSSIKTTIICPEHGEFKIIPNNFLQGQECLECTKEKHRENQEKTFIESAKKIHNNKYDYSKVKYVDYKTKVTIICPEHGEFEQIPFYHLRGQGCPKCLGKNKTTIDFINELKEKYKDKNYDYSQVKYVNAKTLVNIICPEHGIFSLSPNALLSKKRINACPKCTNPNANMTTEEFIKKAKEVHGDKYDYSKTKYVDSKTKVSIICPEHGEFELIPSLHLKGCGCHVCRYHNTSTTLDNFISKSKEIHGDKYDYSKVNYIDNNTKVCIICHEKDEYGREHGEFWQTPSNHLAGKGCKKCSKKHRLSLAEFIETARLKHGNKYDYSKVEYKNSHSKICIICPEHGEFWQDAKLHLSGAGCPNCQGLRKEYKFNLLQEFESEYAFRAFLANNDINILQVILRNIEPKFEPIKRDIERALMNAEDADPIRSLEEKYRNEDEEENEVEVETIENKSIFEGIDLDDDEAVNAVLTAKVERTVEDKDEKEPTIEDVVKNNEQELQVINRIEHMLTPEDREYIMKKFLNDKRRAWIAERESKLNK